MFTLVLTETSPIAVNPDVETDCGTRNGVGISEETFEHFRHNFRTLPADKIARINAILAEPPAPQRKTRSDAGQKKAPKTTTPPQPTLDIR